jgi:ribosomal protein S18 acetylase RimI-like enzyme
MGHVTIRPAVRTDLEHISRMDAQARVDQSRRPTIEGAIGRGECLVALDGATPLGFGVMNHEFFGRGFVLLIYVDAAHRRRHIATCLFDEFERRCKTNRIFTSANLSNRAMQALLTARGYALSGIVQDLDPGDPEILYSKRLR